MIYSNVAIVGMPISHPGIFGPPPKIMSRICVTARASMDDGDKNGSFTAKQTGVFRKKNVVKLSPYLPSQTRILHTLAVRDPSLAGNDRSRCRDEIYPHRRDHPDRIAKAVRGKRNEICSIDTGSGRHRHHDVSG